MRNYEYALFSEEKPLKMLKDDCKSLKFFQKTKLAPYIRRAEAASKKAKAWHQFMISKQEPSICTLFVMYFDTKIDKTGKLMYIPQDPGLEFQLFFLAMTNNLDDKYIKSAKYLIRSYSESIDYFVKAFLSIRTAKEEYKKLQAS
jgi:hypothetical protein